MHRFDLARAVEQLESTVFRPDELPEILARIGKQIGFDHFHLVHSEFDNLSFIATQDSLEGFEAYARDGWLSVDYRAANVNRTPYGRLFRDHLAIPDEERLRSAIYNEFYVPRNAAFQAAWRYTIAGSTWVYSLTRSEDKGPVQDRDVDTLVSLAPYANRALLMGHHARQIRVQGMIEGLASADIAAIVIDNNGQASLVTPRAEAMFNEEFGVRNGKLWASAAKVRADLESLSQQAQCRASPTVIPNIVVRRVDGRRPILVQPLPIRDIGLDVLPGARLLVMLMDLNSDAVSTAGDLRQLFDLSTAEAEVAALIGLGLEPNEIARRRGVGIETVRAQLKSIFRKLDVGRQSEVVRILARMSSLKFGYPRAGDDG